MGEDARVDALVEQELGDWKERANLVVFYTRATCRSKGYALGVHGSLRRDIDVIAVPWTDEACDAQTLADDILDTLTRCGIALGWDSRQGVPEEKPLGRVGHSIMLAGDPCAYLDLSIAPRLLPDALSTPSSGKEP